MNFKHLFPTFRNRYRFVREQVNRLSKQHTFDQALNLGTGEGDYDRMLAGYCRELIGCDVNEDDLAHARSVNQGVMNLRYEVNDALNLSYANDSFDLVVSCEVIEHVGKPERMLAEIFRVLKPGGYAVLTFPSREFPFTYDPVNRVGHWLHQPGRPEYLIHQGAYAFGHDYLIPAVPFKRWATDLGFEIHAFHPLSGYLVGLLEMYWTGLAQRLFKKNARNLDADGRNKVVLRPGTAEAPALAAVTDAVLFVDRELFTGKKFSVGKGVVLHKLNQNN